MSKIEQEVKDYEDRVQETAHALDQKQRLEEKINELNSLTGSPLSQKETNRKNIADEVLSIRESLKAHVGNSPVRGGKAIKTDCKTLNNLN